MKKKIMLLNTVLLGVGLTLLASCNPEPTKKDEVLIGDTPVEESVKKENTFQATTGVSMLNLIASQPTQLRNTKLMADDFRNNTREDTSTLEDLLPQLDLIMNNDYLINSVVEETTTEIEGKTFSIKETVTFKDQNLNDVTYEMVYNTKTFTERDDDEIESHVLMDGYVLLNDSAYRFDSRMESESEWDESESERNFRVFLDERSYIFVEDSLETEGRETESELEYTYIKNGRVELNYSLEIEKEGFENSIEFEVNDKEYEVSRFERDGKTYLAVKIEEDDDHFKDFKVFEKVTDQNGNTSYQEVVL